MLLQIGRWSRSVDNFFIRRYLPRAPFRRTRVRLTATLGRVPRLKKFLTDLV